MAIFAGMAAQGVSAGINTALNEQMALTNYTYGEKAANASDQRTRALYTDLYSPKAKVQQLKEAGLSVGLMYGNGGASGTSSTSGAQGTGSGNQQAARVDLGQALQLGMMKAQIDNLNADTKSKEQDTLKKQQETLKLGEEIKEIQQKVTNLVGEKALQGWSQRQLMTISDSELKSYSEGAGWQRGWSEGSSQGTSQGTSKGKSEQGGGSIGANVGVMVLGTGGNVGANASGNYGYSNSESQNSSQNTSQSKSENKGGNTSKSETTSTGGSRNVVVWPQYDDKGKLEYIYMYLLTGDYRNISTEFRRD